MSTRRSVSALGILLLLTCFPKTAEASEECHNMPNGMRACIAGIKSEKLTHVAAIQERSQWCWAASISMVFGYHGHPVSQEDIVKQAYGTVVNMPAGSGAVISKALNRTWRDSQGARFSSRATAFDVQAGTFGVSNDDIVRELRSDRPLVVGTKGHAMVVTAMQYVPGGGGRVAQVLGVTVRDPWPGRGKRQLTPQELQPMYVATVHVDEAADDTEVAGNQDGCHSDSDCHAGRVCDGGSCKEPESGCKKDSDCDDDEICEHHRCVPDEGGGDTGDEEEIAHWCCTQMGKFGPYHPNDVHVGDACWWNTPYGPVSGTACN